MVNVFTYLSGADYPTTALLVDVANKEHMSAKLIAGVVAFASAEAEALVGMAATFAVVQTVRDNFEDLIPVSSTMSLWEQTQHFAKTRQADGSSESAALSTTVVAPVAKEKEKRDVKTKAAKVSVTCLWSIYTVMALV